MRLLLKLPISIWEYRLGVNPDNILFNMWFQIIVCIRYWLALFVGVMALTSGGKVTINEGTYQDANSSRVLQRKDHILRTSYIKTKKTNNNNSKAAEEAVAAVVELQAVVTLIAAAEVSFR